MAVDNLPVRLISRTPLHAAAFADNVNGLQLLLRHQAEANAADQSGRTPLMMAAENGRTAAVGKVPLLDMQQSGFFFAKDKGLQYYIHRRRSKTKAAQTQLRIHSTTKFQRKASECQGPIVIVTYLKFIETFE